MAQLTAAAWYDNPIKELQEVSKPSLWAIPLGGLGEFGMNMLALRTGNDILVIDAGMMFPEAELLGVDIVIPDITYLKQNREQVRAIVLTHGHEDHIGALPYILRDLNVPVFGTRFALALVRKRLEEHGLLEKAALREVIPGRHVEIGPFEVEFIHVTHSTIDCVALAIRTPVGVVIHTGDYKMDPTPVDGQPFDLHAFARYGQEGVFALFSDSFFFFNDTATTEIYTLSLHDALPICAVMAFIRSPDCLAEFIAWVSNRTDRKSTRLNSSHRTISYAVFCLKKKKT